MLIALITSLTYLIIQMYLQNSLEENNTLTFFFLLSSLVPLLFILISWLPERGVLTVYGILFLFLVGLPIALAVYLSLHPSLLKSSLNYFLIRDWSFSILPPLGITIYVVAIFHQLFRLWRYQQPFDATVTAILIALLINFALFDQTIISVVIFTAAQVILLWGVLRQSHDMAYLDELTSLPGRRALNEALKSPGRKFVLAMMDIDHFKNFNDKYGHDVGDDVLKIVAGKIAQVTGNGKAFRYGGEEFTILFKGKELEPCIPHLEAVRKEIAQYLITLREKNNRPKNSKDGKQHRGKKRKPKGIYVTISIGVAKRTADLVTPEMVLKESDKALYKAKKAGRNCLVSAK
ncbi:MAG: GGDEF domain-containing protein [Gammaproteobacteria bacterium]|nr:GGDEF domain-containing protein [Gammaproteobacteria bacterium]